MKILENTENRLVIEWRPWGHAYGTLFFALWFSYEILVKFHEEAIEDAYLFGGGLALTAFLYWMVYKYGQATCLTLDRVQGTADIARVTLLGPIYRSLPLTELHSVDVAFVPGQVRLYAVVLIHKGASGTQKILMPAAHLLTRTAIPAVTTISDWLDSPTSAA